MQQLKHVSPYILGFWETDKSKKADKEAFCCFFLNAFLDCRKKKFLEHNGRKRKKSIVLGMQL